MVDTREGWREHVNRTSKVYTSTCICEFGFVLERTFLGALFLAVASTATNIMSSYSNRLLSLCIL